MEHLTLPRLAGTREAVCDLLSEQGIPDDLRGHVLVVQGRNLASGSPSFADQLVKTILKDRHADELIVLGAPERFVDHVREAAERRGLSARVSMSLDAALNA